MKLRGLKEKLRAFPKTGENHITETCTDGEEGKVVGRVTPTVGILILKIPTTVNLLLQ